MKKIDFNEKQKKIINIATLSILTVTLGFTIFGMTSTIINKRRTKTVSAEKMIEPEIEKTEIVEETVEEVDANQVNNSEKGNKTNKSSTNNKATTKSSKPYYIKVNYGANVVTIYTQDSEGEFTVPVKAMICSTGRATPRSGTYKIGGRWRWLGLVGGVYGQYCTQITGNILFHSVPYLKRGNPGSLEYWEYDKLRNYMLCRMR